MSRVHLNCIAWAGVLALVSGSTQKQTLFAQATGQAPTARTDYCWADTKTGKHVKTRPRNLSARDVLQSSDPNHYTNSNTGQNFAQQPDGSWIDTATGQSVDTTPLDVSGNDVLQNADPNHYTNNTNSRTGQNFVRVPCPPPPTQTAGVYLGGEIIKNIGRTQLIEELAATGTVVS